MRQITDELFSLSNCLYLDPSYLAQPSRGNAPQQKLRQVLSVELWHSNVNCWITSPTLQGPLHQQINIVKTRPTTYGNFIECSGGLCVTADMLNVVKAWADMPQNLASSTSSNCRAGKFQTNNQPNLLCKNVGLRKRQWQFRGVVCPRPDDSEDRLLHAKAGSAVPGMPHRGGTLWGTS
jgi:hypothetical protein